MTDHTTENDLTAAAAELRRLERIGNTPIGDVSAEDEAFYTSHPLSHMPAPNVLARVADWLDSLALPPAEETR